MRINRVISLIIILTAFAYFCKGQEIMYIEYKDGRSVKEELSNVDKISFHHLDELPSDPVVNDISRGLVAYYTFDDGTVKDSQNQYNGFLTSGTFIADTPNNHGKALFLKRGECVFIPYAPLDDTKNYTISMWVKDFGAGYLFQTYSSYRYGPSFYLTEEVQGRIYTGYSENSSNRTTFSSYLTNYQSEKWHLITIVTSTVGNDSKGTNELYIDGQLIETGTSYTNSNNGAVSMGIGSSDTDPFKVDNVRIYNVALTQDEISSIYQKERQPTPITVSVQNLYFDKNTDKQTIELTNNSLRMVEYKTSSKIEDLSLSSVNSYIPAKESKKIIVSIKDRNKIETFTTGSITIESEGMYYSLDVQVEKGVDASPVSEEVSRGLQAYYKFDDETIADSRNGYDGTLTGGSFTTDTPNGKGKSLFLKKGEYATIAYAPFDGKKNYSVSVWIKDFGAGSIIRSYDRSMYGPSVQVTEEMNMRVYTGYSENGSNRLTFSADFSNYQSESWTMVTIVTKTNGNNSSGESRLYINGQRVNSGTSYTNSNSGAVGMSIGSSNTDPLKIDNVRLYSVSLTDEEVEAIYNAEKK